MNISDETTVELTSDEELLLEFLIENQIKIIKPKVTLSEIKYEGLEDFISENGYDWDLIPIMLSSLEKKKILRIIEDERFLLCPECNSPHAYSKYSCPKCQSTKLSKIELIEHKLCGYTATRDKFQTPSGIICPNCKQKLSNRTRAIIGSAFECESCGQRFERPNILHQCQKCNSNFNYKIGRYEKIVTYETNINLIKSLSEKKDIDVLLIEDNSDDADIIKINLEKSKFPYEVEVGDTGKTGLDKLKEKHYDIIIVDYILPDMTGIKIIEEIKRRNISTPIIMLTGVDEREIAVSIMKLGASDYLVKSTELYKNLPEVISKILKNN